MNHLYPVFLKAEHLRILITGSGDVLHEKVKSVLNQSPAAQVEIISHHPDEETKFYLRKYPHVILRERDFVFTDLNHKQVVFLASRNRAFNERISLAARRAGMLVNVADMPDLCNFYLGSIVNKGNLKIGISTNGKSPVMAKRIREFFESVIPDETDELISNLHSIRENIEGDFKTRAEKLNQLTASMIVSHP